jgi:uncharacterized protein
VRVLPLSFSSDGLALEGELALSEDPRLVVLLCHGIPSGRPPDPTDAGYAGLARQLADLGMAAVWLDFRGVRRSPGEFSMAGWTRDLAAAIDALDEHSELAGLPRVLCGSSAGGGVAIVVGAHRSDVAAVATLASPASYTFGRLVDDRARFIAECRNSGIIRDPAYPEDPEAWWSEFLEAAPEDHVAKISPRPVLIIHGDADDVVSYMHAERLFAAAAPPKELVRISAGAHQLRRDPRAVEALADWLVHLPL